MRRRALLVAAAILLVLGGSTAFAQSGEWVFEGEMRAENGDWLYLFFDAEEVWGQVDVYVETRAGTRVQEDSIVAGFVEWAESGDPVMVYFVTDSGAEYYGWFDWQLGHIAGSVEYPGGLVVGWYAVSVTG